MPHLCRLGGLHGLLNLTELLEHGGALQLLHGLGGVLRKGGGHQNVAGAQITGTSLEDVYNNVIKATQLFIEENEKDESKTSAGC